MGDFADMALSDAMDMDDLRFDYLMGDMSDRDAYEHGILDEWGGFGGSYIPQVKMCKYCGKGGLHWMMTKSGWRLADGSGVHSCRSRSPVDDFDDLSDDA